MKRINNFVFYLGLFNMNVFKEQWKPMLITTAIVGTASTLVSRDPWCYYTSFMGWYLSAMVDQLIIYKKQTKQQ